MKRIKFWKRLLALSLVYTLMIGNCVIPVRAEDKSDEKQQELTETGKEVNTEQEKPAEIVECQESSLMNYQVTLDEIDTPDNEELFAGYVDRMFYGSSDISTFGNFHGERLNGQDKIVYQILREQIEAVAAGQQSSPVLSVPVSELNIQNVQLTAEDLGISSITVDGHVSEEVFERSFDKWFTFDMYQILLSLLNDCPYDLYWFDKTKGFLVEGGSFYYTDSYIELDLEDNLNFSFYVVDEYALVNDAGERVVDTSKAEAAQKAADHAKSIVQKYENLSDYEKMKNYKDEICALTSYNYNVADDLNVSYGNPWQLIWVFDGDPNTAVVCEGYSKAFQYLCDLSAFKNSDIECYLISGIMDGVIHMWNIVRMENGLSYLVDVTNCDEGTSGYPEKLFLASAETGTVTDGFDIAAGEITINYRYDSDMEELYGSILELAKEPYVPRQYDCDHQAVTDAGKEPTCTETGLTEGSHCSVCGEILVQQETISAKGHNFGEWITEGNTAHRECTICGYTENKEIEIEFRIISQPIDFVGKIDDTAQFKVEASGEGLRYQWQYCNVGSSVWRNSSMPGYNTEELTVKITEARIGQKYRCMITDENGNHLISNVAELVRSLDIEFEITSQPKDYVGKVGETAKFTVEATGENLKYQWQFCSAGSTTWKNSSMPGNSTKELTIEITEARIGQKYRCVITNESGKLISNVVKLEKSLETKFEIVNQPKDYEGNIGETAKFTVEATGENLKYQWQFCSAGSTTWKNSSMPGNKTAELTIEITGARIGQKYRCVITDAAGNKLTSDAAVLQARALVEIVRHPQDQKVQDGEKVVFSVEATGEGLSYRWQYSNDADKWFNSGMTGANTPSIEVNATLKRNGQMYRCVVEDKNGNQMISNYATLTVTEKANIVIIHQPESQTVTAGEKAVFSIEATGKELTYRWQYSNNGTNWYNSGMSGADTASIEVSATLKRNGQKYRCVITDVAGNQLISNEATLTVNE